MKKDRIATNISASSNPHASNPHAVPAEVCGTGRSSIPIAIETGLTTVVTMKVRGRNDGNADIMYVHDSRFRRRFKDLSACAAPDNVWVCREGLTGASNSEASNPNAVRSSTLTGFTTVENLHVRRRNEGNTDIMYMHDLCNRRRFKDLSACAAPDNVWVINK